MKRSPLVPLYLALFAFWLPGNGQAQTFLTGIGYPTSMGPPCCVGPDIPVPGQQGKIIGRNGKTIQPSHLPTDGPFDMYFSIPVDTLQNRCGGLQPGNFKVGYDFLEKYDLFSNTGIYGTHSKGTLQSFTVSIVPPAARSVALLPNQPLQRLQHQGYTHTLFQASRTRTRNGFKLTPIETDQGRYPLPLQAAQYFVPGNTLVLHAEGFQNIYVGVWCANPPKTSQPSK